MSGDPIDAAIDAADAVEMMQIQGNLGPRRPIMLALPADATDLELLAIVGWITGDIAANVVARRERTAHGGLIVPRRLPT